jgi:hypothetical protein
VKIESIHSSVHELCGVARQNSLAIRENSAHTRTLARILEIHELRIRHQ